MIGALGRRSKKAEWSKKGMAKNAAEAYYTTQGRPGSSRRNVLKCDSHAGRLTQRQQFRRMLLLSAIDK